MVRQDDNQAPLQQDQSEELDSFGDSSEESEIEEIILIPVSEMKDRARFLSKVGLIFSIYYLVPLLDMRMAKQFVRTFRLEQTVFVLIGISLAIKLSFSFIGKHIRNLATLCFVFDLVLFFFIFLGLYFYLNERLRKYYIYQGHYVIIVGITLFLNSIFYFISTFIGSKKKRNKSYKFLLGFVLITFSTILSFVLTSQLFIDESLIFFEYAIIFIILSVWNFYLCHNSHLLIRYRAEKFYEHEQIYAFFSMFGDFLFQYWHDLIVNSKFYRKNKKRKRLAKLKAKKQKETQAKRLSKKIQEEEIQDRSNGIIERSDLEANSHIQQQINIKFNCQLFFFQTRFQNFNVNNKLNNINQIINVCQLLNLIKQTFDRINCISYFFI